MLEKVLYFFVHYGVLTVIALVALLRKPQSRLGLWAPTALFLAIAAFLYFWGQWPLVGSYYLRYFPVAVGVLVLWRASRAMRESQPLLNPRRWANAGSLALLGLGLWIGYGVFNAIVAFGYPEPMVDLEFPLRDGRFYISGGGAGKVINNHQRGYPNSMEYALDINALGPAGGASSNVLSPANENHHIFGHPVYAPCSGVVTEAVGDVADNSGASMSVRPEDGSGNYIYMDCDGVIVALVHLQYDSVTVRAGDRVRQGERIGAVGNSGYSEEPHLHFQAAVVDESGNLHGVPMRFDGETYARNDIVVR